MGSTTVTAMLLLFGVTIVTSIRSIEPEDELVGNHDRLITVCSEDKMEIHLRKDFEEGFHLKGNHLECQPVNGTFKEYDGKIIPVKTWTLSLKKGHCGLKFVADTQNTNLGVYETTMIGPDRDRTVSCTRTGPLEKNGSSIFMEVLTPRVIQLKPINGTVEVWRRATISAAFHHQFSTDESISLHPIRCWLINERSEKKRLVVDKGCPLPYTSSKRTIVVIGSESADEATGDHPHIMFNAQPALFGNEENSTDLPPFRLECEVMPCKGLALYQQIIGVARCPAIVWCDAKRELAIDPTNTFKVTHNFSITISSTESVKRDYYRPLPGPIYPGEYWKPDIEQREDLIKTEF